VGFFYYTTLLRYLCENKHFMKRHILILLLCLITNISKSQALVPQCDSILGNVLTDTCVFYPLNPPVQINQVVTKCFNYYHNTSGGVNLSYLIVNSFCGPISPYNYLNFELYNSSCDSLVVSGQIIPNPLNAVITPQLIDSGVNYTLCLTWRAKCTQFSICPLLYESALPVSLLNFDGKETDHSIKLEWSTATEENNDYFVLYKLGTNDTYYEITKIPGAGNSNIIKNYIYYDNNKEKINYYKLTQVDYDGRVTELKVIAVKSTSFILNKPVKVLNILGQEVDENYDGFKINVYEDGTIKKN